MINLNRGTRIVFSQCSNPLDSRNIVREYKGVKIVRCDRHGGYYVSIGGSSGGYHYKTIQGAIQGWKATIRAHNKKKS